MSEVEIITVGNSFSWEIPFGHDVKSAPFRIHGMKCHLELCTGWFDSSDCRLYLERDREPADPFDLSVRLIAGKEEVSGTRTTVESYSTIIWRGVKSNLLKVVPEIDRHEFIFRIDLLGNTTHKEGTTDTNSALTSFAFSLPSYHSDALSRDFARLLDEDPSTDVEISCGGQVVRAHRIVLAARSKVFAAMLQGNMEEAESGRVVIEDVEAEVFDLFLRYVYTGVLPNLTADTARGLYEVADKYAILELRRACAAFLCRGLTKDNACDVLALSDRHGDREFKDVVIQFIMREKIPRTYENWTDFCEQHPKLSTEVFNRFYEKFFDG